MVTVYMNISSNPTLQCSINLCNTHSEHMNAILSLFSSNYICITATPYFCYNLATIFYINFFKVLYLTLKGKGL